MKPIQTMAGYLQESCEFGAVFYFSARRCGDDNILWKKKYHAEKFTWYRKARRPLKTKAKLARIQEVQENKPEKLNEHQPVRQ